MSTSLTADYVGSDFDEVGPDVSGTPRLPRFRSGAVYWASRRATAKRCAASRRRRKGAVRRRHER